jgi:serine/threonine-protein kinase
MELSDSDVIDGNQPTANLPADLRKVDEPGMAETEPAPEEPEAPPDKIASDDAAPTSGRYEDVGEIGRGGMGRVNNVRDTRLRRSCAMKTLDPKMAEQRPWVDRFIEEAQIQAQLEHPNIAPAYDLGVDKNGVPFFTMKLVKGTSLSEWLSAKIRPPGSPERLGEAMDAFVRVCDALAFAHANGILHLDLKPANIMLGTYGEVYVMDWGLARAVGQETAHGEQGGILGTPAYISPEAARGETSDERSDVFGLGAILYNIVTGKSVYGSVSPVRAVLAARTGAVIPADEAAPNLMISKKLLRILSKALAPAREDRYQSVVALRADIHQFLRGGLNLPRRTFAPGTRIVVEGQPGHEAFIVVEGKCEAYKMIGDQRRTLRTMGPGEVFGETAVLSDTPRTATVEAIDEVTVIVIDRAALEDGLGFDTWLGTIVKALATRFRELDARLTSISGKA